MSPRTGRPKIENPKSHDIKVRVDDEMNHQLMEYAIKHNVSKTEVIRLAISKFLGSKK